MRRPVLVLLALSVALAGCAGAPPDGDGDGVPDALDAFPDERAESRDTDNDGTGDNADGDDDNDGAPDGEDLAPRRDARINLSLESIQLLGPVAGRSEDVPVWLELLVDDRLVARFPADGELRARVGVATEIGANHTIDVPENQPTMRFALRAYGPDPIDLHPAPDVVALAWTYTTTSGAIAGAGTQGPASGRGDGGAEPDARVDYALESVG